MKAPPLLVGHRSAKSFFKSTNDIFSDKEIRDFTHLANKKIPPVTSLNSLALLFQYSQRFLFGMARRPKKYYRSFTILKGTKKRRIDAPRVALKVIQSWFGYHLSRSIAFDECVHGFAPGRSTVTAAKAHCGAEWVLSMDIKDFFPSITANQVAASLKSVGYSIGVCRMLARLLTLNEVLPQGSPASPVLANLVFRKTDIQLKKYANAHGLTYTRYADDLCFSSREPWSSAETINDISAIIKKHGWTLAAKKTRLIKSPNRLLVLGLIVNGLEPRLPKAIRNKVRLAEHLLNAGFALSKKTKFQGYLSYARSVKLHGGA